MPKVSDLPVVGQEPVAAVRWKRCRAIYFINDLGAAPRIEIYEERVTSFDGTQNVPEPIRTMSFELDRDVEVPLLSLATGAPTGRTFTHADLAAMLFSVYKFEASK